MRILLYCINYAPELTGIGKYTTEMAEWLERRGHLVRVVTSPPYYPAWKVAKGYHSWRYRQEWLNGVDVFRCPLWVPRRPSGSKRLLHLLSFAISSLPVMLRQVSWRPDVIFVVEPPLFCAPLALITARFSNAKAWLHIQDFEVEAFFGLGFSSSGIVKKIANCSEGFLMRRFDRLSSISQQMAARIATFGLPKERISVFPNWVDTDSIRPTVNGRDFRREWGLMPDCRIVLYAGSMGQKQGLEMVLETANELQQSYPDVMFLFVGEGSAHELLVDRARALGLRNVLFKPPQPLAHLPALLSSAAVHLVVQKRGAADAVMPSKLTGILAIGGYCVITADQSTELGRLVSENPGIAHLVEPENKKKFKSAVLAALSESALSCDINEVARSYAELHLATSVVLSSFEETLFAETGLVRGALLSL